LWHMQEVSRETRASESNPEEILRRVLSFCSTWNLEAAFAPRNER
jgi:hypothetical protein